VVVAEAAPCKVTVALLPPPPLITPEIVNVGLTLEVKSIDVTLLPLSVTVREDGLKRDPVLFGVIVYCPFGKPENV
jgi:hypothetical protein